MTRDDRTYILRLLDAQRASLANRVAAARHRIEDDERHAASAFGLSWSAEGKRVFAAHLDTERAHLVSLEAELARCDEVIAAVEAMP